MLATNSQLTTPNRSVAASNGVQYAYPAEFAADVDEFLGRSDG
jgi:hypothetical protein